MSVDKMFEQHWKSFTSLNIPIFAVYNYSYATTVQKAITDARAVIALLDGRKTAVCLDVEDECQANLGESLIHIINAYKDVIEGAGYPFLLYTGQAFYNSHIKPYADLLECTNLWIARYYKGYDMFEFADDPNQDYKPMKHIISWLYTSSGHLNKCSGNYDFNIIYKDIDTNHSPISQGKVCTMGSNLNVRETPVNGRVIKKLSNNTIVNLIGIDPESGWYKVANGGYVSPQYIVKD